jgi:hypothetical protein
MFRLLAKLFKKNEYCTLIETEKLVSIKINRDDIRSIGTIGLKLPDCFKDQKYFLELPNGTQYYLIRDANEEKYYVHHI